jgi:hypothetical protein
MKTFSHFGRYIKLRLLKLPLIKVLWFASLLFIGQQLMAQTIVGVVYDAQSNVPLAYANIGIIGKSTGTVSNENGQFYLNISGLEQTDTLACAYLGYETRKFPLSEVDKVIKIALSESSIGLLGISVLSEPLSLKEILEKVLQNKEVNYSASGYSEEVFSRTKTESHKESLKIKLKKSTFDLINKELITDVMKAIPNTSMNYEDWLYRFHYMDNKCKQQKIKGIRHSNANLDNIELAGEEIEKQLNRNLSKDVYWKIKSGPIFGTKLDMNIDSLGSDSIRRSSNHQYTKDTLVGEQSSTPISRKIDRAVWEQEFLTKSRKYKYTLEGEQFVSGENAYVISFSPKDDGVVGRMYVSTYSFAILQIEYKKHADSKGEGVKLLGIEYRVLDESCLIYFQSYKGKYHLKYMLSEQEYRVGIDRPLSLIQKRKRFLIDKTLEEVDLGLDMKFRMRTTKEILVTQTKAINDIEYAKVQGKLVVIPQTVEDYTDPKLWEGHTIIEPTKAMKEYKTAVKANE